MTKGYDKLYLDITLDVLTNMASDRIACILEDTTKYKLQKNVEELDDIEKIIKLVKAKRETINGR